MDNRNCRAASWGEEIDVVVGLDVSDKVSTYEGVDRDGVRIAGKVKMTVGEVWEVFAAYPKALVVMEAGTQP